MTTLRGYQQAIVNGVDAEWAKGNRNVMAVSATGSGKTVIFSHMLAREQCASVAIAHRSELVTQMSLALARNGVRHRVIGPSATAKACVSLHLAEVGRSYFDPSARCAVAGVDTLVRRDPKGDPWFAQVGLVVQDECFPAGTLIDGRPIEKLQVGDYVRAFDEDTGRVELRRVNRLYRNVAPKNMMRLTAAHHVLECTSNHPFYTRRGWVAAKDLTQHDYVLLHALLDSNTGAQAASGDGVQQERQNLLPAKPRVRASHIDAETAREKATAGSALHDLPEACGLERPSAFTVAQNGPGVLQCRVLQSLPGQDFKRNDGAHESPVRLGSHEVSQPDGQPRDRGQDGQLYESRRASTEDSRWQRARAERSGERAVGDVRGLGVCDATGDSHGGEACQGRAVDALQTRPWELGSQAGAGSGRCESYGKVGQSEGREERSVFDWHRLDRIEVLKREDTDAARRGVCDGHVYNFEVDGLHTYIADGFVVHNCHHVLKDNKWGSASAMFPNARTLGVTATPVRADGKGLGSDSDGIMDAMVLGPSMRELIIDGFLTEYRVFAPPVADLDLASVPLSAGGDFSPPKLRAAVHKSHITGDVVAHYLRVAGGKLGVTFAVDVESAGELARAYRDAGVPAEVVSADTPDLLRAQVLRRFRNREVLQLVNVDLFGEGFDLPAIEVVSMARPTQSYGLYVQQFGRALRPLPGKEHAIILDHVGNVMRHGLPDAPRTWSLSRRERRSNGAPSDVIPMRVCLGCTAAYERYRLQCPHCGYRHEPAGRGSPEQVDGVLGELDPAVLARMRGEVALLDGPYSPTPGLPAEAVGANRKRHWERQVAQGNLRRAMTTWGGWQTHQGRDQTEAEARFYFRFGIDLVSAWALPRAESEALRERIVQDLVTNGVILQ